MEEGVTLKKNSGLGIIEFSHPQSNSMPGKLLRELADAIDDAGIDPEIIVILLKSSGEKTFCAGAFFDELLTIKNEKTGWDFFMGFANVINSLRRTTKFVIGRVQGKCVGGGVGLAAAVDYCFATEAAEIRLSELVIGIGPFVVGPAVERKMGLSAFSQLSIDAASWRSSYWAKTHGLFAEVFPTISEMDDAIERLIHSLLTSNPEAMAQMKKIFWTGTDHWDQLLSYRATISGKLVLSEYTKKALAKK